MEEKNNTPQPEENGQEKKPGTLMNGHGRNWITDLYDKVNVSVNTLNIVALGLIIFIFAVIIIASTR